jgi:hypothetical protein
MPLHPEIALAWETDDKQFQDLIDRHVVQNTLVFNRVYYGTMDVNTAQLPQFPTYSFRYQIIAVVASGKGHNLLEQLKNKPQYRNLIIWIVSYLIRDKHKTVEFVGLLNELLDDIDRTATQQDIPGQVELIAESILAENWDYFNLLYTRYPVTISSGGFPALIDSRLVTHKFSDYDEFYHVCVRLDITDLFTMNLIYNRLHCTVPGPENNDSNLLLLSYLEKNFVSNFKPKLPSEPEMDKEDIEFQYYCMSQISDPDLLKHQKEHYEKLFKLHNHTKGLELLSNVPNVIDTIYIQ